MANKLPTPKRYEPLTPADIEMLRRSFTGIQAMVIGIYNIDQSRGAGVLPDGNKCVWTKDGKRITFWADGGAIGASATKEVDPLSEPSARS